MNTKSLKDLAQIIGWKLVNEDQGFSIYEYVESVGKYEKLSHIVKIENSINDSDVYEIWLTLKSVLPKKLQRILNKITKNVDPENISSVFEVVNYTIEEFRSKTDYSKLKEYGSFLGLNIEDMGYFFEYTMPRKKVQLVLSQIESKLPIELAPVVGKMKKIEYRIGFVKNRKNLSKSEE